MNQKLKKWNIILGFLAFLLSISLLFSNLMTGLKMLSRNNSWKESLVNAIEDDYQNTEQFRWYISDQFSNFLAMAVGDPLSFQYNNYYTYQETAERHTTDGIKIQDVVVDNVLTVPAGTESSDFEEDILKIFSPADNKEAAENLHKAYKDDKNMLYIITYEGKTLYTNVDELHLDGPSQTLPEGYNFLLYFDGKEIIITKDGKEIDIYENEYYENEYYGNEYYGNEYYGNNGGWYFPGYTNLMTEEKMQKATICIAISEIPIRYFKNRSNTYLDINNNTLYWMAHEQKQIKKDYISLGITSLFALVCLLIYLILRKQKRQGDKWLAKITGKIIYEVKLLFLIFITISIFIFLKNQIPYNLFYWIFQEEGRWLLRNILWEIRNFSQIITLLLFLFWSYYLFINDMHYNVKPWKHSIFCKLTNIFKTEELKLPFQKRIIVRYLPIFASEIILVLLTMLLFFVFFIKGDPSGTFYLIFFFSIAIIFLLFAAQIAYVKNNKCFSKDLGILIRHINAIRDGNLTDKLNLPEDTDLSEAVACLNDIQQGIENAVNERIKSEQMKVELVSNVSHDIKTPLTSIISYVELLKQEDNLPEHVRDYIHILDSKSQRLKFMVQDVFEVSKAASGQLLLNLEVLDLGKLLRQTLADMETSIKSSTFTIKTEIPENPIMIVADGQRLYRVFQNLLQNALNYSLPNSRIFLSLIISNDIATASIKNTSQFEIPNNIDFTERFMRGDKSRTNKGSGLGLSIAKSFTESCGGHFDLQINADLFIVMIEFPIKK